MATYGLQKVKETEPRDNMDIAKGALGTAASGAKIGNKIGGTYGAVAGGVIGAGYGLFTGKSEQFQEKEQLRLDESYNRFVDDINQRGIPDTNTVAAQAKYGMYSKGYISDAEIEGDGSGREDGAGEVHVDSNYNIKNLANGKPTHKEGGVDLPKNGEKSLQEGDVIFNWQGSKKKFEKGMNMLNRYKFRNDPVAKRWLDKEKESLPTDKDYAEGKYPDGYNYITDRNDGWDYRYKGDDHRTLEVKKKDSDTWNTGEDAWGKDYKGKPGVKTNQLSAYENLGLRSKYGNYADETFPAMEEKKLPSMLDNGTPDLAGIIDTELDSSDDGFMKTRPMKSMLGDTPELDINIEEPNLSSTQPEIPDTSEVQDTDYSNIKDRTNPLKYTNIVANLLRGSKKAESPTRRYLGTEELKYRDTSAAQRQSAIEQRNAQALNLRGKGLSSGQQQSYMSQAGSRYMQNMGNINAMEAQKRTGVDQYNAAQRARVREMNLNLANQYDTAQTQNEAMRQSYLSSAFKEISDKATTAEQRRYMKDRDERAFDMDEKRLNLMESNNYKINKNSFKTEYKTNN